MTPINHIVEPYLLQWRHLRLVSCGAAIDGVAHVLLIVFSKLMTVFSYCHHSHTLRLTSHCFSHSAVFFVNSTTKKLISFGCHPPWMVSPGVDHPPSPSRKKSTYKTNQVSRIINNNDGIFMIHLSEPLL